MSVVLQAHLTPSRKLYLVLAFVGCWLGGVFDGLDSSLMQLAMPIALPELTHLPIAKTSFYASIITSTFLLGWSIGGMGIGWFGDRYGRVKAMILSVCLYSLATGLCGLAQHWYDLALFRLLAGIGIGGEIVSIVAFLSEIWPNASRVQAVAFLITCCQVGQLLAGTISLFCTDWRTTFFIGALPALLVVFLRLLLRESPQWEKAKQNTSHPPILLQPSNSHALWTGTLAFGSFLFVAWGAMGFIPMWLKELPQSPAESAKLQLMIQSVGGLLGCVATSLLAPTLGRRGCLALGGAGLFTTLLVLFTKVPAFDPFWVYGISLIMGFSHGLTQSTLYVYIPELFPTLLRMQGSGFCLNAGRILTAIAVLGMGSLVQHLGGFQKTAFYFCFIALLLIVVAFISKQTKGHKLT
ncbi:MAG: MFS transporter [Vampirovibrionales bacterium]